MEWLEHMDVDCMTKVMAPEVRQGGVARAPVSVFLATGMSSLDRLPACDMDECLAAMTSASSLRYDGKRPSLLYTVLGVWD